MATSELSLENLKQHVGRRATSSDVVTAGPANLLRLAFARPEPEFRDGDPLPPGWQILYFLPRLGPDELRPDGSPLESGVVPPMPLPRRMFAGERLRFHRPIRIGDTLRRDTELADLSLKTGGTGTLVFATTVQRIFTPAGLALEEERRTVFREEVKAGERNQAPRREPAPADVPWRRRVTPDPVVLFRFSALTFNSHRIHYAGPGAAVRHGAVRAPRTADRGWPRLRAVGGHARGHDRDERPGRVRVAADGVARARRRHHRVIRRRGASSRASRSRPRPSRARGRGP
ncbi:MAG: hypothetical protein AUI04_02920 [Candidatus Rokubacteria bacterium 13_2_20CM_2_64_8]|nr:MAG: hypothetical protein AUI04_02920 [Candidatus Rokubacteria bacterium 13_2_20CM_2_64_8]